MLRFQGSDALDGLVRREVGKRIEFLGEGRFLDAVHVRPDFSGIEHGRLLGRSALQPFSDTRVGHRGFRVALPDIAPQVFTGGEQPGGLERAVLDRIELVVRLA